MKSPFHILLFFIFCKNSAAVYYDISNDNSTKDVGEPLFLTEYIEKGLIAEAQEKARVRHPALKEIESYSGFITVDKTHNSNTFFWFFPSQTNPKKDPVVVWFIGGPGISVLIALFTHNGPLVFTSENILETRNYSLTVNHSMIYIDNPIGTGYSFTDDDQGYARTQADVARNVLSFLDQFFKLFPQYRHNDFYTGGDSYGGKFVVSTGNAIRKAVAKKQSDINFKGLFLGNGVIDTKYQLIHSDYVYNMGLVTEKGRDEVKAFEDSGKINAVDGIIQKQILIAKLTGFTFFSNILYSQFEYNTWYIKWAVSSDFRRALHIGDAVFNDTSDVVRSFYELTNANPVTQSLEEILQNNYRVLVYNGQLDASFPYTSSQNLYNHLNWTRVNEYKHGERSQWWIDGELAGYIKTAGNFYEVMIRDASHITFIEQPKWSCELVTRFTHCEPIVQEAPNVPESSSDPYIYFIYEFIIETINALLASLISF